MFRNSIFAQMSCRLFASMSAAYYVEREKNAHPSKNLSAAELPHCHKADRLKYLDCVAQVWYRMTLQGSSFSR
jgi:hypothetical protein